MFNINFSTPIRQRFTLFDVYFDVERLAWQFINERLEYKLKVYMEPKLGACLMPTPEVSQAYFLLDHLVMAMQSEKDLNKHLRLIGPSSSSKTVILNTFETKLTTATKCLPVPMSAYLTLQRLRTKIEECYTCKRKNTLVPRDAKQKVLLVIDDIHMQRNLKVEVLEFIRSWSISRGYFDVPAGYFKKVGEFGTVLAENSEFVATSKKQERFLFSTTTLYCDEISIDKYKPFVNTWLTTAVWPQSGLMTKFYILVSNALQSLAEKMKRNEGLYSNSSLSKIHKFQYISQFCANIVTLSLNTERADVFNVNTKADQQHMRREEDAVADIFCYQAMRTFGDRIMRPSARADFQAKLSEICHKEYGCDKTYSPLYIDSLVLGNYHVREPKAHVTLNNVSEPGRKWNAVKLIQEKCKLYTGNQLLHFLLDVPTGLNDLFRMSRIFFKDGQHLAVVGQAGSGKHELMQLAAILNDVAVLEFDMKCFG